MKQPKATAATATKWCCNDDDDNYDANNKGTNLGNAPSTDAPHSLYCQQGGGIAIT
jgi:hypothetical protein